MEEFWSERERERDFFFFFLQMIVKIDIYAEIDNFEGIIVLRDAKEWYGIMKIRK